MQPHQRAPHQAETRAAAAGGAATAVQGRGGPYVGSHGPMGQGASGGSGGGMWGMQPGHASAFAQGSPQVAHAGAFGAPVGGLPGGRGSQGGGRGMAIGDPVGHEGHIQPQSSIPQVSVGGHHVTHDDFYGSPLQQPHQQPPHQQPPPQQPPQPGLGQGAMFHGGMGFPPQQQQPGGAAGYGAQQPPGQQQQQQQHGGGGGGGGSRYQGRPLQVGGQTQQQPQGYDHAQGHGGGQGHGYGGGPHSHLGGGGGGGGPMLPVGPLHGGRIGHSPVGNVPPGGGRLGQQQAHHDDGGGFGGDGGFASTLQISVGHMAMPGGQRHGHSGGGGGGGAHQLQMDTAAFRAGVSLAQTTLAQAGLAQAQAGQAALGPAAGLTIGQGFGDQHQPGHPSPFTRHGPHGGGAAGAGWQQHNQQQQQSGGQGHVYGTAGQAGGAGTGAAGGGGGYGPSSVNQYAGGGHDSGAAQYADPLVGLMKTPPRVASSMSAHGGGPGGSGGGTCGPAGGGGGGGGGGGAKAPVGPSRRLTPKTAPTAPSVSPDSPPSQNFCKPARGGGGRPRVSEEPVFAHGSSGSQDNNAADEWAGTGGIGDRGQSGRWSVGDGRGGASRHSSATSPPPRPAGGRGGRAVDAKPPPEAPPPEAPQPGAEAPQPGDQGAADSLAALAARREANRAKMRSGGSGAAGSKAGARAGAGGGGNAWGTAKSEAGEPSPGGARGSRDTSPAGDVGSLPLGGDAPSLPTERADRVDRGESARPKPLRIPEDPAAARPSGTPPPVPGGRRQPNGNRGVAGSDYFERRGGGGGGGGRTSSGLRRGNSFPTSPPAIGSALSVARGGCAADGDGESLSPTNGDGRRDGRRGDRREGGGRRQPRETTFDRSMLVPPADSPMPEPEEKMQLETAWSLYAASQHVSQGAQQVTCDVTSTTPTVVASGIDSVESLWKLLRAVPLPAGRAPNFTYYWFRRTIKPTWEDPRNKNGGTLSIVLYDRDRIGLQDKAPVDDAWLKAVLALCGETLSSSLAVNGMILKVRTRNMTLQFWTNTAQRAAVTAVGKSLRDVLCPFVSVGLDRIDFYSHAIPVSAPSQRGGRGGAGGRGGRDASRTPQPKRDPEFVV